MVETKVARWWRAGSGAAERANSLSGPGARCTSPARRDSVGGGGVRPPGARGTLRAMRALCGCPARASGSERAEGAERAPHAKTRVLATVQELLGLHEELDLADAATPELHVARRPGRAERGVHPSLHRLQVLDRPEVEIAAVDEGHELGDHPPAEGAVPPHPAGPQPPGALPRLPPGPAGGERRRPPDGDPPPPAAPAEPPIDAAND